VGQHRIDGQSHAPLGCTGSVKPLGHLWDDNFEMKPAYTGVVNALLGLWPAPSLVADCAARVRSPR
jgi:hypothetical protein